MALPVQALAVAAAAVSFVSKVTDGDWFSWFPGRDVVLLSATPCPVPRGGTAFVLVHIHGSKDLVGVAAWVLLLLAALMACVWADSAAQTMLGVSITMSTLSLAWAGTLWLERAVAGEQDYLDRVPCNPSDVVEEIASDRANYFRALWPLCL
ncbi:hypothetical protein ACL83_24250, partial [Salmonella enterica subsp. enterica serovar Saintpaul]|nr:hypothetical protein [Salmonella enterica subsp. enterica serovar Saintpaul]